MVNVVRKGGRKMSSNVIGAILIFVYAIIAGCTQYILWDDDKRIEKFCGNFFEFMSLMLPMLFWPITFFYLGIKWIIKKIGK